MYCAYVYTKHVIYVFDKKTKLIDAINNDNQHRLIPFIPISTTNCRVHKYNVKGKDYKVQNVLNCIVQYSLKTINITLYIKIIRIIQCIY